MGRDGTVWNEMVAKRTYHNRVYRINWFTMGSNKKMTGQVVSKRDNFGRGMMVQDGWYGEVHHSAITNTTC